MHDRTEVIRTTPDDEPVVREVETTEPERVTEVTTAPRPRAEVDRHEAVAYDPYASRRVASWRLVQAIWLIFGVIEGLIVIRFVLRALGANASAGFAEFIYGITAPLVAPFVGLFGNPSTNGSVLELNSIVALIAYFLLAWLLAKVVWLAFGEDRSATTTRSTSIETRS
jgi:YggT family protein